MKCTLNSTPGLVCDLIKAREECFKSFHQFFHLVLDSCQSHNGLISSRPTWRQWAGFGLLQDLWFGFGLCGLWSAEKNRLFWRAFLLYVSHMHVLSVFFWGGRVNLRQGLLCLLLLFVLLATSNCRADGGGVYFDNKTDLVTALSLPALRPFYLLIIKSYHSTAPLCLIHLQLSFNRCHTAPVFCLPNWLDLAINQLNWLKPLWSVTSVLWPKYKPWAGTVCALKASNGR